MFELKKNVNIDPGLIQSLTVARGTVNKQASCVYVTMMGNTRAMTSNEMSYEDAVLLSTELKGLKETAK